MINKLPRWVWIGGFVLSFLAGIINAVGFFGVAHEAFSHVTGLSTLFAHALASAHWLQALHLLGSLLCFFAGATLSGIIIGKPSLQLGGRYSLVLALESALLLLGMLCLYNKLAEGSYAVMFACGLQNAMVSTYSGAVIRSTHITGIVTDLGIMLGHFLRGEPYEAKRSLLLAILLGGFVSGGMAGVLAYRYFASLVLLVPALFLALLALAYSLYCRRRGLREVKQGGLREIKS